MINQKELKKLANGNMNLFKNNTTPRVNTPINNSINYAGLASAMSVPRQRVIRYPKNTTQKQYLKKIKQRNIISRFSSYYTDVDGDRVVNAMDCYPFDKSRHGVGSWLKDKYTYAKSYVTAPRYKGEDLEEHNKKVIEAENAQIEDAEDQMSFIKKTRFKAYEERGFEKEPSAPYSIKQEKEYNELKTELKREKAEDEKADNIYRKLKETHNILKKQLSKTTDESKKQILETRLEKLEYDVDDADLKAQREQDETDKIKNKLNKLPKELRGKEPKLGKFGSFKESIFADIGYTSGKIKRGASKLADYRFEEPAKRQKLKEHDIKIGEEKLDKQVIQQESLTRAAATGLSPGEQSSTDRETNKLQTRFEKGYISKSDYISALKRQEKIIKSKSKLAREKRKFELGTFGTQRIQQRQQEEYAKLQIAQSKFNIGLLGPQAEQKRVLTSLSIAQAREQQGRMRGLSSAGDLSQFTVFPKQRVMPGWNGNEREEKSLDFALIKTVGGKSPLLEMPKGRYDPKASRFVYRRRIGQFTRKSTRVQAKEKGDLFPGMISIPSSKKSKGAMFPWTKPMKGFDREFVGSGRHIKKGRPKRGKTKYAIKTIKPPKRKFTPFLSTYGSSAFSKGKKQK